MKFKEIFLVILAVVATLGLSYVCAGLLRQWRHPDAVQIASSAPVRIAGASDACIAGASTVYQVPVQVLLGMMRVEGGHTGQAVANTDGSYDLGIMQINTVWVPQLAQLWQTDYRTAYQTIRDNGCSNIYIGAWILKQKIVQTGTLYNGIAYYHSANRVYGIPYANKVMSMI